MAGELKAQLLRLERHVRTSGSPSSFTLERGLKVSARMVHDEIDCGPSFMQISLTRDKVTPPSEQEAAVVMRCLGWGASSWTDKQVTRAGLPCILINHGASLFGKE